MRQLPWPTLAISLAISLIICLCWTTTVDARHFWQTYGSTASDGCGCTWNANQDYFVPRHPSSGQYGLYSPCKSSRYNSPACKWCHPLYPGYCSIYGPCHYRRRNHVYAANCGCSPISTGGVSCCRAATPGCGATCGATSCCVANDRYIMACQEPVAILHNVESSQFHILGSIPVEAGDLLTKSDFSQLGERSLQPQLQQSDILPLLQKNLPSLGQPAPETLIQPVPKQ